MRFSQIRLTNFRSFGPGTVEIPLPEDSNLIVVIGPNNSGKSNLVHALRLILANSRDLLDETDFWRRDTQQELAIELVLRAPLKLENIFRGSDEIGSLALRCAARKRGPDEGVLNTQHYGLTPAGSVYVPPAKVGGSKKPDSDTLLLQRLPTPGREIARRLGPVYFLEPSMSDAFRLTGWGPLARLLDLYRDDFAADDNTYEIRSGEVVITRDAYERLARRLAEILRTPLLDRIESTLTDNLRTYLGPADRAARVNIGLPPADDLLRRLLRIDVEDDERVGPLPLERLGLGYQSLLRLAILRTYASVAGEDPAAIFLVEEPEAYLHPHLRRHFLAVLGDLALRGHTVILTTHDGSFVDLSHPESIIRVARADSGSSRVHWCSARPDLSYERIARKLHGKGNEDVVFSTGALLCEGALDAAAVRELCDRLSLNSDVRSISVVDAGSRENLPDYVRLCSQLAIPYLVVSDTDTTTAATNPSTKRDVERLAAAVVENLGGTHFAFRENLEFALGITMKSPAAVTAAARSVDLAGAGEVAGLARAIREFVASLDPPSVRTS